MCLVQKSIIQKEGAGALFKGGLVRAIWTAPQGAMNFAGLPLPYVLAHLSVLPVCRCFCHADLHVQHEPFSAYMSLRFGIVECVLCVHSTD